MKSSAVFHPGVVQKRAERLLYSRPGEEGLLSWAGLDVTRDLHGQTEMAAQAVKLSGVSIPLSVMRASLGPLFDGLIRKPAVEFMGWRIAANLSSLAGGRVMGPWQSVSQPTLAPLEIVSASAGWSKGKQLRYGTALTFKVIDGELCPLRFDRWFANKFLWIIARELQLRHGRDERARYSGARNQLVGMRCLATLVPSVYDPAAITFERFTVGQFTGHNQSLLRLRATPCHLGFIWPCHRCTMGVDRCPRACRPLTLQKEFCRCCNQETFHDDQKGCLSCLIRKPSVTTAR